MSAPVTLSMASSSQLSDDAFAAAFLVNVGETEVFFASHDTWGIRDTGATKTVMGSNHVLSLLQHVHPSVRNQIKRCTCDVVFRFGNQGTLKSEHAMVVPVCGLQLKIAIVPGSTPFLISITLLRALGAMVDTGRSQLVLPKHSTEIPLTLSDKGLYLIDMNSLLQVPPLAPENSRIAETFAQESQEKSESVENDQAKATSTIHSTSSNNTLKLLNNRRSSVEVSVGHGSEVPIKPHTCHEPISIHSHQCESRNSLV